MPRTKKGNSQVESSSQKSVHSYLERISLGNGREAEGGLDVSSAEITGKELKTFLTLEFSKTNENIRGVDSRLSIN